MSSSLGGDVGYFMQGLLGGMEASNRMQIERKNLEMVQERLTIDKSQEERAAAKEARDTLYESQTRPIELANAQTESNNLQRKYDDQHQEVVHAKDTLAETIRHNKIQEGIDRDKEVKTRATDLIKKKTAFGNELKSTGKAVQWAVLPPRVAGHIKDSYDATQMMPDFTVNIDKNKKVKGWEYPELGITNKNYKPNFSQAGHEGDWTEIPVNGAMVLARNTGMGTFMDENGDSYTNTGKGKFSQSKDTGSSSSVKEKEKTKTEKTSVAKMRPPRIDGKIAVKVKGTTDTGWILPSELDSRYERL